MTSPLKRIESHPHEAKRLIGIEYDQFLALVALSTSAQINGEPTTPQICCVPEDNPKWVCHLFQPSFLRLSSCGDGWDESS